MYRRLTCSIILGLVIAVTSAQAKLIHHWKFDEDTVAGATIAMDSSGGLNGTIDGAQSVPGQYGNAMSFDGTNDVVTILGFVAPPQGTIAFWINPALAKTKERILGAGGDFEVWLRGNGELKNELFDAGSSTTGTGAGALNANEWVHVVATYDSATDAVQIYFNGVLLVEGTTEVPSTPTETTLVVGHRGGASAGEHFGGLLDDLQIYDHVLSEVEILRAMSGIDERLACAPSPGDGEADVSRDTVLSWTPGIHAPVVNGHTVYLSENFNDVNDGVGATTQDATSYDPGRLEFGTVYYWRVDEVNAPPDSTVFQGEVWSFTTEPVGYPIDGADITATASSSGEAGFGPEKTIDGSGLDADGLHSTNATDMWLSGNEPLGTWIQYEFDKVHKLHEMWVWNSNQIFEGLFGFGMKTVTVEYSTNGADWTALAGVPEFTKAPGADGYAHNTTVDFGGAAAKYVKLTATSNWGGMLAQYGLSEVRFFSIPVSARRPSPESGAGDIGPDVILSWRAGREAATHDVYLSMDERALTDGTIPAVSVTEASYSSDLDLSSTYYWRVDEVNEAETPATWQGDVWSFSTPEYLVVDDFEDYNDYPPNEIYSTWLDGYEDATNGSQVGNLMPPLVETTIVHGGRQSMPLFYSNTGSATYSEATRTFAPAQDWTKHSIQILVLYFYGTEGNTGQLYVKVNGDKVPYPGDAADIANPMWVQWNIDLAPLGVNLASVTNLALGIDGNGSGGTLYIDDIALYRLAPESDR
ncbi:MAG: discoidin domain-containing protein [Phycisphaerales bacterium]|nr:MAG: discoidin domain-containing protein [Phycisphaerales bacterium]